MDDGINELDEVIDGMHGPKRAMVRFSSTLSPGSSWAKSGSSAAGWQTQSGGIVTDRLTDAVAEFIATEVGQGPTEGMVGQAVDLLAAIQSALGPDRVLTSEGVARVEEPEWHCEAEAVGYPTTPCSPLDTRHSDPCGWRGPLYTITQEDRP